MNVVSIRKRRGWRVTMYRKRGKSADRARKLAIRDVPSLIPEQPAETRACFVCGSGMWTCGHREEDLIGVE